LNAPAIGVDCLQANGLAPNNVVLILEPSAVVETVFLEIQVFVLVVDTNLSLVLEVVSHSCKVRAAQRVLDL
jgi:hypothetical protein